MTKPGTTRRGILLSSFAATAVLGLGRGAGAIEPLPATPECRDAADLTPAQTEGPYYTPETPLKGDFSADGPGTPLWISGFVLSTACRPLAGAVVDIWHADAAGAYDNAGYRFRGHQLTNAEGVFAFRTVVPGLYPARTRHVHVKVQAPGSRLLTTQLYFPGEAGNARDRIFDPALVMATEQADDGAISARFDLALALG